MKFIPNRENFEDFARPLPSSGDRRSSKTGLNRHPRRRSSSLKLVGSGNGVQPICSDNRRTGNGVNSTASCNKTNNNYCSIGTQSTVQTCIGIDEVEPLVSPSIQNPSSRNTLQNQNSFVLEYIDDYITPEMNYKESSTMAAPRSPPIITTTTFTNGPQTVVDWDSRDKDDNISLYGTPKEEMIPGLDAKGPSFMRSQIEALFQPSDNKLAMKLFGSKKALMNERARQKESGLFIIHPCSTFR